MKKINQILLMVVLFIFSCSDDNIDDAMSEPENCIIGNNYDYDCDGVTNEEDYRPKDPSQTEDVWGKIVETKPEVFFASDISQKIRDGFMSDLNLITSELGNYGPLEWWNLGRDIDAANELAKIYCKSIPRAISHVISSAMPNARIKK